MIKNKYIILPFLFAAWTIIFAHSIIPHHHHSDDIFTECNNCKIHLNNTEIHDCDLDCNSFTCHFQVKVLTQVSIDNVFIINTENPFFNNRQLIKERNFNFNSGFISEQIPKTKFLRGPPQINIS